MKNEIMTKNNKHNKQKRFTSKTARNVFAMTAILLLLTSASNPQQTSLSQTNPSGMEYFSLVSFAEASCHNDKSNDKNGANSGPHDRLLKDLNKYSPGVLFDELKEDPSDRLLKDLNKYSPGVLFDDTFDDTFDGLLGEPFEDPYNGLFSDPLKDPYNGLFSDPLKDPYNGLFNVPSQNAPMEVTEHLQLREGWRDTVYLDSLKKPTAGLGHLLTDNEKNTYKVGDTIPTDILTAWAVNDIKDAYDAAYDQTVELGINDQDFINALTSVNFQLGTNWNRIHTETWKHMVNHDWTKAANEAQDSKWYDQTPIRVNDFQNALLKLESPDIIISEVESYYGIDQDLQSLQELLDDSTEQSFDRLFDNSGNVQEDPDDLPKDSSRDIFDQPDADDISHRDSQGITEDDSNIDDVNNPKTPKKGKGYTSHGIQHNKSETTSFGVNSNSGPPCRPPPPPPSPTPMPLAFSLDPYDKIEHTPVWAHQCKLWAAEDSPNRDRLWMFNAYNYEKVCMNIKMSGGYVLFIDFNDNGTVDDCVELLCNFYKGDKRFTTYQILDNEITNANDDEWFSDVDPLFSKAKAWRPSENTTHTMDELNIIGFHIRDYQVVQDDYMLMGQYADCKYLEDYAYWDAVEAGWECTQLAMHHMRIVAFDGHGVALKDGSFMPSYDFVFGYRSPAQVANVEIDEHGAVTHKDGSFVPSYDSVSGYMTPAQVANAEIVDSTTK